MAKKLFIILVVLSSMFNISFASEANSDDTQIGVEVVGENEEATNVEPTYQEEPQMVEMQTVDSEQDIEEKEIEEK